MAGLAGAPANSKLIGMPPAVSKGGSAYRLTGIAYLGNLLLVACVFLVPSEAIEFIVFLWVFFNVAIVGASIESTADLLCPYYAVLILYSLYSCSAAGSIIFNAPGAFTDGTMLVYYVSVLAGLVGLIGGYQYVRRWSRFRGSRGIRFEFNSGRFGLILLSIALVLIPVQALFLPSTIQIRAYTEWAFESRLDVRGDVWGGVNSYFSGLTLQMLIAAGMFMGIRYKSLVARLGFLALLASRLTVTVMTGHKGEVLCAAFLLMLYLHYRYRPLRGRWLVGPAVVLYVFSVMISHVRFTTSLPMMVQVGSEMIMEDPKVLLPINAGELNGPPVTLMRLIEAIGQGELEFSFGTTYLTELAVWIPRAIFPARPLPLAERYMTHFFLEEHLQGRGHGFFIPTEGYWAFGVPGVVFQMFLFGASIAILYGIFQANVKNDVILFIYSLATFSLVFSGIRSGLFGAFRGTLMAIGPFLAILPFCLRRKTA